MLEHSPFEAGLCWDSDENETPNLEDLLKDSTVIDGVYFSNLERVRNWKAKMGREKDLKVLELIDAYLRNIKTFNI